MSESMSTDHDAKRIVRSWLHEDRHEDADRVLGAVLDQVKTTPQHRPRWSVGGMLTMNKFLAAGLGAAAVVAVLFIGAQLRNTPIPGGPSGTQSAAPSEAPASVAPSSAGDGSLPVGLHVMVSTVGLNEDRATVTIPAPGWFAEPDEGSLTKDLGGDDRVTVVAVPGDHYRVPRNICSWQGPGLYRGAETVDELVAYLAEQTWDIPEGLLTRDFSTPVDITIGGHPGQSITGAVPGSDPDGCDEHRFCSLADRDGGQCLLSHLEPNAIVTVWISAPPDRNPRFWVVAASYWPTTGSDLRAEMMAIVDSMTILHIE